MKFKILEVTQVGEELFERMSDHADHAHHLWDSCEDEDDEQDHICDACMDQYMTWAYEEVIPKYDSFIDTFDLTDTKKRELVAVAAIFLAVCGQIGIFDLAELPHELIHDFPNLFKETVIGPQISNEDVASHLKSFILFLETFYAIAVASRSAFC